MCNNIVSTSIGKQAGPLNSESACEWITKRYKVYVVTTIKIALYRPWNDISVSYTYYEQCFTWVYSNLRWNCACCFGLLVTFHTLPLVQVAIDTLFVSKLNNILTTTTTTTTKIDKKKKEKKSWWPVMMKMNKWSIF